MRGPRTLSLYVLREAVVQTAFGATAIGLVLVSGNLIRFADAWAGVELRAGQLASLLGCIAGMLLPYLLPISFLFGVLLCVARLCSDREVLACRSCGLGMRVLLVPLTLLGVGVSAATATLMLEVEHRSQRELRALLKRVATEGTMLEPGSFRHIGDRVLYVQSRDRDELGGVVISDRADPERPLMIFAESGSLRADAERGEVRLTLRDGDIHVGPDAGADGPYQRISFQAFDTTLAADALMGAELSRLRPREMPMHDLRAIAARARSGDPLSEYRKQEPAEYEVQIHRRLALPFAPILFVWVGVPIGLRMSRNARSRGAIACAGLAFAYYALLTFGQLLALRDLLPAALALWVPNAVFAAAAAALLFTARRPAG